MTTQINFNISNAVAEVLDREARSRGYSRTAFAGMLFDAVYNERFGRTKQEPSLDNKIQIVLVMWGADKPVETIASAVGLKVETIEKIMASWRDLNSVRYNPQAVAREQKKS